MTKRIKKESMMVVVPSFSRRGGSNVAWSEAEREVRDGVVNNSLTRLPSHGIACPQCSFGRRAGR